MVARYGDTRPRRYFCPRNLRLDCSFQEFEGSVRPQYGPLYRHGTSPAPSFLLANLTRLKWIRRLREHLKAARTSDVAATEKLTSDQALKLVQKGDVEEHVGFDAAEAGRLGLTPGQTVAVTPTDTGKRTVHALTSCPYHFHVMRREKPSDCGHADRVEQGGSGHSGQGYF